MRWLGNRIIDGAAALIILIAIFEGPTITAIVRDKLRGG